MPDLQCILFQSDASNCLTVVELFGAFGFSNPQFRLRSPIPVDASFFLTGGAGANQIWSLDFIADQLADGRRFRALTVVDVYTRESLAIEAAPGLKGNDVVRVMNRIKAQRGAPQYPFCDNGSEFTGQAMDLWHIKIRCASTSRGRASRPITRSSSRSTEPSAANVSAPTGLLLSKKLGP